MPNPRSDPLDAPARTAPVDAPHVLVGLIGAGIQRSQLETALLKAARERGCRTVDGDTMAVGQAVGAFRLFTGLDADAARVDAHFRRLVAAR